MKKILLFLLVFPVCIFAQRQEVFRIDSLPKKGVLLNQGWKWHAGDNPEWAKPEFDDSNWKFLPPLDLMDSLPQKLRPSDIRWLRLKLQFDKSLINAILALAIDQIGASEIYMNGKLLQRYGVVSSNPDEVKAFNPLLDPIPFIVSKDSTVILAVRYTYQNNVNKYLPSPPNLLGLTININTLEIIQSSKVLSLTRLYDSNVFRVGAFFILFISYFALYFYNPHQKANLFLCLFSLTILIADLVQLKCYNYHWTAEYTIFSVLFFFLVGISKILLLAAVFFLMDQKINRLFVLLSGLIFLSFFLFIIFGYHSVINLIAVHIFPNLINLEIIRITLKAIQSQKKGAWIIALGGIIFLISVVLFVFMVYFNFIDMPLWGSVQTVGDLVYNVSWLSIPLAVAIYFGQEVAFNNSSLKEKLIEVEQLSVEKQLILSTQNETLEHQVAERTAELSTKNRELEIEAALERVRSQAMSMQKSNELAGIIGLINQELGKLDTNLDRSYIMLLDANKGGATWWMASSVEPSLLQGYQIPYHDNPPHIACLEAWKKQVTRWEYILSGLEKKQWAEFIFNHTELSQLPKFIISNMRGLETAYWSASFNKYGCISTGSFTPLTTISMDLLVRFSHMFEQTYTRFLDLQKAEEQAEQARLNLIQIQTEKKRAEDALIALKQTQAQLIQSEKLASLGELTAGIAHEIQNPLNFVNNFSELSVELLEEMESDFKAGKSHDAFEIAADLKQNLSKINHHGQRASAIVKGMLEHSRTSDAMHRVSTDLNALADEYLRLAYHGLRAKDSSFNATMETHFDPDLPKIEVIPQDIGRVLLNLINNAFYTVNQRNNAVETLHATSLPYQPTVTITTRKLENAIEISVKDNGNGIPEAIKDKIFQPFFTTKPTGQGTGLGLSLAYDIVTKGHGGKLEMASTIGEGTEFCIHLPS